MTWLYYIVLGLIAGILGKFIMPGKDPGGLIITILLGIGGAFLGAWLGGLAGFGGITGEFDWKSILTAIGGVVVLLFLYRVIKRR
jgi:uncharacterized membrane protein YeaQ/YmgE (transglycosylase-associated protein family)